jgi:hypothetical protein
MRKNFMKFQESCQALLAAVSTAFQQPKKGEMGLMSVAQERANPPPNLQMSSKETKCYRSLRPREFSPNR